MVTNPTVALTSSTSIQTQSTSLSTTSAPSTTTSNSNSNTNISTTSIPATALAGGLTLLTPAPSLTRSGIYYKVGTTATWVWNYTSLLATPSAIDILASLSYTSGAAAPSPFTLALNTSFSPTQTFTWDTGAFALQTPLPVGNYTLVVYDADQAGGATAVPSPGRLAVYKGFVFGVYTPQAYVELENAFVCATCSAAWGRGERLVMGTLVGVVGGVVGGFLWFGGVAGVFW